MRNLFIEIKKIRKQKLTKFIHENWIWDQRWEME